jgi:hypothetical protein
LLLFKHFFSCKWKSKRTGWKPALRENEVVIFGKNRELDRELLGAQARQQTAR